MVHHRECGGTGELNMLYRPFRCLGMGLDRGLLNLLLIKEIGLMNIMPFIKFLNILLQNTNGVNFYNILTQQSDEMKSSSNQATDGFLCESQHAVFQNFCLLHKCFRHHFVFVFCFFLQPH